MCGADHGPEHDDPSAARLCELSRQVSRRHLGVLEVSLDQRERELLWQVGVGVGPEGLARRLTCSPHAVRAELDALSVKLAGLVQGAADT